MALALLACSVSVDVPDVHKQVKRAASEVGQNKQKPNIERQIFRPIV